LTGVEVLPGGRAFNGLAVFVLGAGWGDFARTVLGCDPVVEVRSVPSNVSPSLMLERDATRGPAWDVMRVPLSTLRRPSSISLVTVTEFFRRMLFALAVFLRSAAVVAVSGGLGGARGGGGATRVGGCGATGRSPSFSGDASTSVTSGVNADFLFSISSREYMFSFAYVFECDGYGKLILDVFSDPSEPRRPISGTTAILCDLDVSEDVDVEVDVRTRSIGGRSGSDGPSVSSSLDADERVLRVLLLL
jgi:hypothetical protein